MNKFLRIMQIVVIIALVVTAAFFIPQIKNLTPEELSELMPDSTTLAAGVLFALFCVKSVIFVIPMILLYICAGLIFSPVTAVIFTVFCVAAEMTIGFFTGRKLGYKRVKKIADDSKYAGKLFHRISENTFVSSFLLRLIPIFSLDIVSLLFGAADVSYPEYIAGSILGIIPGMIPVILAGNSITEPLSRDFLIPFSIFLVLSVCCTIIYYIKNRKLKNNCCEKEGLSDEA